jgi:two-component system, NarL family, sensor kinase
MRRRGRTYERRELVYVGFMRLAAAAMFAGLNAIAGEPFSPELVAVILLAVPYALWTMWLGAYRTDTFDARILIPLDLVVIGAAVFIGEGPESQATVIYFIWTIAMAILYPPRFALACAGLAIVGASIASIPAIVDDPSLWEELFLVDAVIAWMALITWCVSDVFRRRAIDIERLSATRRRLLTDALGAEERARRRLSDALQHDALQVLLSAGQDLDAAKGGHPWIASRARERIRTAVRSLRETVRTLHPAAIAEAGLAAGIDAVAERAAVANRTTADVRVDPAASGVNDALLISLARELTLDAALGSAGAPIAVVVGRTPDGVELAVSGHRAGSDELKAAIRHGESALASSRERVEAVGGAMRVGDDDAGETCVVAAIPAQDETAHSSAPRRTYGKRELRYFAVARLAAMPLFTILNAVAGTPVDLDFAVVVVLSLVYGAALVWLAFSRYWDRIDARWFAAADLICLGVAITVTGGPESELRAAFFAWPIALSMLFPPRIVMGFALLAMTSFAVFSLPEVLTGGEQELRALCTFELSFVWINMMSWFVAGSFWNRATRIERLSELRQRLLAEALNAEDRARRRLSQQLHDDALQVLLAAGQDLDAGLRGDEAMLERGREELRLAVHRLQDVIRGLDPSAIEHGGLAGGIDAVVEEWARRGGFSADVRVDSAASSPHDGLVFSIVRELVSNAAKHSEAAQFGVEVARAGDELQIEVFDDGRGMDLERPGTAVREGHIGLASCGERVAAAGGTTVIDSAPGSGTRISITLPVVQEAETHAEPEAAPEPQPALAGAR